MTESAKYFAGRVEELSGGRMVVEIYPSGRWEMMLSAMTQ